MNMKRNVKATVPPGWHHVNVGIVGAERMLEMFQFIWANDMAHGVLNGQFDLINTVETMGLPLKHRWALALERMEIFVRDLMKDADLRAFASGRIYEADFAFRDIDAAAVFRLKYA